MLEQLDDEAETEGHKYRAVPTPDMIEGSPKTEEDSGGSISVSQTGYQWKKRLLDMWQCSRNSIDRHWDHTEVKGCDIAKDASTLA